MLRFEKRIDGLKKVVAVRNMFRGGDGLYQIDDNTYIVTFCHGYKENGAELGLQVNDEMYDVTPQTLRQTMQDVLQYDLGDKTIVITPCFPAVIKNEFGKELAEHNILVEGDWDAITNWDVVPSRSSNGGFALILNSRDLEDYA